jgi:hypothetical protein
MKLGALLVAMVVSSFAHTGLASVIYSNDFESAAGGVWSVPAIATTPSGRHFLGQDPYYGFGGQTVTLTLEEVPQSSHAVIEFDLFVLQSWNGANATPAKGPDLFVLGLESGEGVKSIAMSFSNVTSDPQSYPSLDGEGSYDRWTGAAETDTLGYNTDSVYHLAVTCAHAGSRLVFTFEGRTSEPLTDESWGIDNVVVTINPEPSAVLLLGIMALMGWPRSAGRTRFLSRSRYTFPEHLH